MSSAVTSLWSLDHILTPANHAMVVRLLSALDISAQWRRFGELLGISPNALDCIDSQERGRCMESFLAVIRLLVENLSRPWSMVIITIHDMDNKAKARALKSQLKRKRTGEGHMVLAKARVTLR